MSLSFNDFQKQKIKFDINKLKEAYSQVHRNKREYVTYTKCPNCSSVVDNKPVACNMSTCLYGVLYCPVFEPCTSFIGVGDTPPKQPSTQLCAQQ